LAALLSLGLITLLETGRMPFNNPETHLELTMTEKAALLEYAGRSLALFRWAEAMRLTFFLTLGANLFFPFWLPSWAHEWEAFLLSSVLYPFKIWVLLFILVFWELTRVPRRIRDVGTLAGLGLAFSILAIVVVVLNRYLF
jgi:formate hydrogenlyase subunit 4